jgi:hypothetical protein
MDFPDEPGTYTYRLEGLNAAGERLAATGRCPTPATPAIYKGGDLT